MTAIPYTSQAMRARPKPCHTSFEPHNTMPFCPISFPLASIALCAVAALIAVLNGPATEDIYAVIGAMLAAVVVLVDFSAANKAGRRGTMQFMTVFISSAFVGSIGPGAAAHWLMVEAAPALTWHSWAALGFVFGLAGWVVTRSVLWVFNRRLPGALDSFVSSKLPPRRDDD